MNKQEAESFKDGDDVHSILYPGELAENFCVGRGGVDRITVCMEYGQEAKVPWFAIWVDGRVVTKVNAVHVETVNMCKPGGDPA